MDIHAIVERTTEWLITSGLRIVLIVILSLVALRAARILANRAFRVFIKGDVESEVKKRVDTLSSLVRYVLGASVLVTALIMILGEFGVDIGPILAAAGVVGLALGFGSQQLVQDVISGFFILLDDAIRVGDVVQTAGQDGLVEDVNLRRTVLRDFSGNVHHIRNGQIGIVTNMTKDYSRYVFDIGVAYREDVDEVMEVIKQVDEELRQDPDFASDILEPIEINGLDRFGDSAVVIKARTKTKPIKQWRVAREFNRRLKRAFDEKGIEIPFPHLTVYAGQDKAGQAPPLRVVVGGSRG